MADPEAILLGGFSRNDHFSIFRVSAIILPLVLALAGCETPSAQPVIVQVTDAPIPGERYRTVERRRDIWFAPQAIGNEILQHEQTVTFIEKPQGWQIPSTLEPHTAVPPDLPLETGEYDATALQRQREIIRDKDTQIQKTVAELENIKNQTRQDITQREQQVQTATKQLQDTRQKLDAALQRLDEIEQTERARREQEEKQQAQPWWKWW